MNLRQSLIALLETIRLQSEPLFEGEAKVILTIDEGELSLVVGDEVGNTLYPLWIDDTDDLINHDKLVADMITHIKSEQKRLTDAGISYKHECRTEHE